MCDLLKVRLASGFFFRASDRSRDISPRPFVGSAVNNRLRGYLTEAKLHDGETPHSFRVGLSTTLRLLGCSQQQVAQYIGWKSGEMAQHYSRSSDAAASLTIFEEVVPSVTGLVTVPVSPRQSATRLYQLNDFHFHLLLLPLVLLSGLKGISE